MSSSCHLHVVVNIEGNKSADAFDKEARDDDRPTNTITFADANVLHPTCLPYILKKLFVTDFNCPRTLTLVISPLQLGKTGEKIYKDFKFLSNTP